MTKATWKKSEVQTKLSREVSRIDSSIESNKYLEDYGGPLNISGYYTFKYCIDVYRLILHKVEEGYVLNVYNPVYNVEYTFSRISAQVYDHPDGRRFTRISVFNDKGKQIGTVDIPEHRRA